MVMSVYNAERYVRASIESILTQTCQDFEFLIIHDGSIDGTANILAEYAGRDQRIQLIENPSNLGLTKSLNKGLEVVRGHYLARHDADDLADPERFEKQVAFLEDHPEVGMVGSSCQMIDAHGKLLHLHKAPLTDGAIRWTSLLNNPFYHSTVMLRSEVLTEHCLCYDETFRLGQDYELWTRLLRVTQAVNLAAPLVRFRLSAGSITGTKRVAQLATHDQIALRTIREYWPETTLTLDQVAELREFFIGGLQGAVRKQLKPRKVELAKRYLTLFQAFARHAHQRSELKPLARQEMRRLAALMLRRPRLPGWFVLLIRVLSTDPGVIGHLFWQRKGNETRQEAHSLCGTP